MACRTPSVERVADKTVKGKEQIDKLQSMIETQEANNKNKFYASIEEHLSSAKITDAREISYNSAIKTEYTSDFSLDKIVGVVTSSLNAIVKVTDPTVVKPALSKDSIDAYVDVVNKVAEAAKSSSTASASLSFSMNRLSPGLYAFLYASSISIQDDETFGSEAVTTTAIYYRFMQSIQDVQMQANFDAALIDKKSYLDMKTLQAALIDELAADKIDLETYEKKDETYTKLIAKIKARLDANVFKSEVKLAVRAKATGSSENQNLVRSAIAILRSKGDQYQSIIKLSQERLDNVYF